jgi:hypothetical protein
MRVDNMHESPFGSEIQRLDHDRPAPHRQDRGNDHEPAVLETTKRGIVTHKYDECLNGEEWVIDQVLEGFKQGNESINVTDLQCPQHVF